MPDIVFAIVLCAVGFIICVYITRWIFGINKIIDNLTYQSYQLAVMKKLLCKMAAKEEVTPEDIKKLLEETSVKHLK